MLPLVTALLLGLLWTHHLYSVGLRLTGDSGFFIQAAQGLFFDGVWDAPAVRPPLYSTAMAIVMLGEPYAADAAALLGGIGMTGSLLGLAILAWRTTERARLSAFMVAILAMWPAFTTVFEVAWTEGLAGCLAVLHVVAIDHYLRHDHRAALHVAALCLGLGALTRFLGLAAIGVFGLAMVAYTLRDRRHVAHRGVAVLTAAALPGCWMIWSHVARGSATGTRRPSTTSWAHNLSDLADQCTEALSAMPLLTLGGGLLCVAALVLRPNLERPSAMQMLEYTGAQLGMGLLAIVAATSRVAVDPIGPRYLAPLMPLVLAAILFAWEAVRPAMAQTRWRTGARMLSLGVVVVTAIGLVAPLGRQLDHALQQMDQPSGHTHGGFAVSATQKMLARQLAGMLSQQDHVHLVSMTPDAAGRWMAFSWHRGSFSGLGADLRDLRTVETGWHTALELDDGRVLSLLKAVAHSGPARARQQLRRALDAVDSTTMVLVHDKSLRELTKQADLAELVEDDWTASKVDSAPPYTLYAVQPAPREQAEAHATPAAQQAPKPALAKPAAQPPVRSRRSAFALPGKHGIGLGWRPTRTDHLETMGRADGTLFIDARPGATSIACGPDVPMEGAAVATGRIRTEGLQARGHAEVTLTYQDESGRPLRDANGHLIVDRMHKAVGTTDWVSVRGEVQQPEARFVRACVWIRGATGRAWADAIEAQSLDAGGPAASHDGIAERAEAADTGP